MHLKEKLYHTQTGTNILEGHCRRSSPGASGERRNMDRDLRKKMVCAMELIAKNINDEGVLEGWLTDGVADGDLEYGEWDFGKVDDYYTEDKNFKALMTCFLKSMRKAWDSGGLFCDRLVSGCKGKKQ